MSDSKNLSKKEVRKMMAEESLNPNHRGRGLTAAEKKRFYADYYARKKIAFEAESRNHQYLVLFLASDGKVPGKEKKFYHMGGKSAIIYAYEIAPMIGRPHVELKPDFDLGDYKFKRGMVSIANLEKLTVLLAERDINRVERKNDNDDIVYFKLNRIYTDDDIQNLIEAHRDERQQLNKIIYSEVLFPDIHSKVLTLKTTTYHKMMKLPRADREVLQNRVLDPVLNLSEFYSQMAHGDMDTHEAALQMIKNIDTFFDRLSTLIDLNLIEASSVARLGKLASELKLLVKGKMLYYDPEEKVDKKVVRLKKEFKTDKNKVA